MSGAAVNHVNQVDPGEMRVRWRMLAILFVGRMGMGFQFGSVGAIAPLYQSTYGIDTATLGLLIGLYFLPGIVVAGPGGGIGARFGDRRVVAAGAALMLAGAALSAVVASWEAQLVGRAVAGIGGIFFNVLMTKMVADWFEGRELSTAMAIFVNSWPAGIALALLGAPAVAAVAGLPGSNWAGSFAGLVALVLVGLFYRSPDRSGRSAAARGIFPRHLSLAAIVLAGLGWGLFNAALAVVFSFAPANLVERGWPLLEAGASTSLIMWFIMAAGFTGGLLSDRTGRPMLIVFSMSSLVAVLLFLFPRIDHAAPFLALLGLVFGLPSGPLVGLTARCLSPQERAWGMGIYYTVHYVIFVFSPWIAGALIDRSGSTKVAFEYAALLMIATLVAIAACLMVLRQRSASAATV